MNTKWMLVFLAAWISFGVPKHEAKAVSLLQMQNPTEPSREALEICNKGSELSGKKLYPHNGQCCEQCPPGFQVDKHCTPTTPTTCEPCHKDTYIKYHNTQQHCFPCEECRQLDQVEIQSCSPTNNTQCSCKNGTFCSPDLPCETCHKCRLRCPDGEEMVQACTPTSDIQCQPYTTPPTPAETGSKVLFIAFMVVLGLLLVILILAFTFRRHCRCWHKVGERDSTVTLNCKSFLGNCQGQHGERDNERNESAEVEPLTNNSPNYIPSNMGTTPCCASAPTEGTKEGCEFPAKREKTLIPANGRNPTVALRQSFETFIRHVPLKEWRRYMRALDLTDNEITRSERSEDDLYEQQFQMLQTWLDKGGKEADLNALLAKLRSTNLRGVEREIREALISQGLYTYEE
ncbi:tumor necrosis factor receptor superfamily member 10A isoform X1 [Pogona vitticeps]